MDDARALLNSLMGADRNARPEQRRIRKFTDDDICRNFLLGLCPHELFKNTKMDLGSCSKDHNELFKEEFEAHKNAARYRHRWRGSFRSQLKRHLEAVDRRIAMNQVRVEREKDCGPVTSEEQLQQLTVLKEDVSEKLKKAERAADNGKFEESRSIIKDTEATKRQIEDLTLKRYEKYRKENICEICGLIIDAEEAEAMKTGRGWHSNGRQHIGYSKIREKLRELDQEDINDRANGVTSPSPSPIRAHHKDGKRQEGRQSRSPARAQRTAARRRNDSQSRSPVREKEAESSRRRVSRSRSRVHDRKNERRKRKSSRSRTDNSERRASRSRSGMQGRKAEHVRPKASRSRTESSKRKASRSRSRKKKKEEKRRASSSPKQRSKPQKKRDRSRKKRSQSKQRGSRSRRRKRSKSPQSMSPKGPSRASEVEEERKSTKQKRKTKKTSNRDSSDEESDGADITLDKKVPEATSEKPETAKADVFGDEPKPLDAQGETVASSSASADVKGASGGPRPAVFMVFRRPQLG